MEHQSATVSRSLDRGSVLKSPLLRSAVLVAVIVLSLGRLATYHRYLEPPTTLRNDFTQDYISAKEWRAGGDPYGRMAPLYRKYLGDDRALSVYRDAEHRNPHPPAQIVATVPITLLGPATARTLWALLTIALMAWGVFFFSRRLGVDTLTAVALACAAVATPIAEDNMRWGQLDGLIMLGLVWAWCDLGRGREMRAGVVLGAITALKWFPWIMIIPLLRLRHWRAAGWMAGVASSLTAATAAAVGWHSTHEFLFDVAPRNYRLWSGRSFVSLVSAPIQWLAPQLERYPGSRLPLYVVGLSLLALVVCVVALSRTHAHSTRDLYWAAMPILVLASPLAWAHQLVLLIPFAILYWMRRASLPTVAQAVEDMALLLLILGLPLLEWVGTTFSIPIGRWIGLGALTVLVVVDFASRKGGDAALRGRSFSSAAVE